MEKNQCAECGTTASLGAKYCERCGAPLAGQAPKPPPTFDLAPGYHAPRSYVPYATSPYQGVAIRFVAILIDTIIILIIAGYCRLFSMHSLS